MAAAVRSSAQRIIGTTCDEMMQLCHADRNLRVVPPVRKVMYNNTNEIAFRVRNPHLPLKSTLRANATPFVPTARSVLLSADKSKSTSNDQGGSTPDPCSESAPGPELDDAAVGSVSNEEAHEEAHENKALEAAASAEFVDVPHTVDPASGSPSDEEIRAAQLIQTSYRRVLSRRKGVAKAGLAASRVAIYETCCAEALKMDWPRRCYRLLFLGPLVHALLCLEVIHADVSSQKKDVKKRMVVARYQELADLGQKQTELTELQKELKDLREHLKPQSELHRQRDIQELKRYTIQIQAIVGRLPTDGHRHLQDDLRIAVKGIVEERKPKKKEKPELCVDDIDGMYD